MRFRRSILLGLTALLPIVGCESRIPKEELGTVVFEVPAVPGSDKPPPMPELDNRDSGPDVKPAPHH
jgi:hypothetical protein